MPCQPKVFLLLGTNRGQDTVNIPIVAILAFCKDYKKTGRRKIQKLIACCYHHLSEKMLVEFSQIPIFCSVVKCCYNNNNNVFLI